jgi:hypothetical protein
VGDTNALSDVFVRDRDPDTDDDGVPDGADNCADTPNPSQTDQDGDGQGDACDPDRDGDGVDNGPDNCRDIPNPEQADPDRDGVGDACDPDKDGDGIPNGSDNCPDTPNPGQADSDQDGVGDACETNLPGRMNGGGAFITSNGLRVTHGFELNCNPTRQPNSLQVNWADGRFHLETLETAQCGDNPAVANANNALFDTYAGSGSGGYNGAAGASASWRFVDAGEPGRNDTAQIVIKDAAGNTVLNATATLSKGNHQALHERP